MDTYSFVIPRGRPCGLKLAKRASGTICVTHVLDILPDRTANPLRGRIGTYNTLVQVDTCALVGGERLQDVIQRMKVPADSTPIRITFREKPTMATL